MIGMIAFLEGNKKLENNIIEKKEATVAVKKKIVTMV